MLIFAQLTPSTNENKVHLRVGRLCQRPQNPPRRIPRPDDPIPRKPPLHFVRKQSPQRSASLNGVAERKDLKRIASVSTGMAGPPKRAKIVRTTTDDADSDVFKIPNAPGPQVNQATPELSKLNGKGRDVFGEVSEVGKQKIKGKQKEEVQGLTVDENALEKANKNVSPIRRRHNILVIFVKGHQKSDHRVPGKDKRSDWQMY